MRLITSLDSNGRKIPVRLAVLGAVMLIAGTAFWNSRRGGGEAEDPYRAVQLVVTEGDTYGALMERAGIRPELSAAVYAAAKDVYDLASIKAGQKIELALERETNALAKLVYVIDSDRFLSVAKESDGGWRATVEEFPYETRLRVARGKVQTSMYEAGLGAGMDERTIMNAAEAFQWTIDFAMDPRAGDEFAILYETRWLEGEYAGTGRVLAGMYVNDGKAYELYWFEDGRGNEGYFDQNGNSARKIFLRAPLEYKYISSGYTTGPRYIEKFQTYSPSHQAIDYAANYGTPIRSTGDGMVTITGWSDILGNYTTIRHNATYSTRYAHQSKIIVRKGQAVKQGQIIGYVGSTGLSTGPHLDYAMQKNGAWINPLRETFPPGDPVSKESREEFLQTAAEFGKILKTQ